MECVEEVAAVPEAPKQDPAPEIIFQYREYEASMDVVTDRVKAHYYLPFPIHTITYNIVKVYNIICCIILFLLILYVV